MVFFLYLYVNKFPVFHIYSFNNIMLFPFFTSVSLPLNLFLSFFNCCNDIFSIYFVMTSSALHLIKNSVNREEKNHYSPRVQKRDINIQFHSYTFFMLGISYKKSGETHLSFLKLAYFMKHTISIASILLQKTAFHILLLSSMPLCIYTIIYSVIH